MSDAVLHRAGLSDEVYYNAATILRHKLLHSYYTDITGRCSGHCTTTATAPQPPSSHSLLCSVAVIIVVVVAWLRCVQMRALACRSVARCWLISAHSRPGQRLLLPQPLSQPSPATEKMGHGMGLIAVVSVRCVRAAVRCCAPVCQCA